MKSFVFFLIFRLISLIFEMSVTIETLINEFMRYIYIPYINRISIEKINKDITNLQKLPTDQVTLVVDVRVGKPTDLQRTIAQIARFIKIIENSINPVEVNCFLNTNYLRREEMQRLDQLLLQITPKVNAKFYKLGSNKMHQKLQIQKSKITPLVVIFSSYPSINGLPPCFLVGAQITFNPQILKSTEFDLFSSVQKYAISEQRKGK